MTVKVTDKRKITAPGTLADIMQKVLESSDELDRDKEHFWTIGLKTNGTIKYIELVSLGTLSCAIIHPREVFRSAIHHCTASVLFCHNHPSGEAESSMEDQKITKQLVEAGKLLNIPVLDHVIICGNDFVSLKEEGFIDV